VKLTLRPGIAHQLIGRCDFWFTPIKLPVAFGQTRSAAHLLVLTMITGYARWG